MKEKLRKQKRITKVFFSIQDEAGHWISSNEYDLTKEEDVHSKFLSEIFSIIDWDEIKHSDYDDANLGDLDSNIKYLDEEL